jgi:hypothetical protein
LGMKKRHTLKSQLVVDAPHSLHCARKRSLIPTLTHIRRDPTRCFPSCALSKLKQTWCTHS